MTDQSSDDADDLMVFGSELSDREIYSIGKIVSLWGALEHEIFWQTYEAFNPISLDQLPKEMSNQQSSQVLELWKKHVVDQAEGKRHDVLQKMHRKIQEIAPLRHAIVHGMWDWRPSEPDRIELSRVKKNTIIIHTFTAEELGKFSNLLAKINFKIRYPEGLEQYVQANPGNYISRQFAAIMSNSPSVNDWFGLREIIKGKE